MLQTVWNGHNKKKTGNKELMKAPLSNVFHGCPQLRVIEHKGTTTSWCCLLVCPSACDSAASVGRCSCSCDAHARLWVGTREATVTSGVSAVHCCGAETPGSAPHSRNRYELPGERKTPTRRSCILLSTPRIIWFFLNYYFKWCMTQHCSTRHELHIVFMSGSPTTPPVCRCDD